KQRAIQVLILLLVATYGWTFGLMIVGILPWRTSIVLLALPFAWQLIHSFRKQGTREDEIRSMKRAALHHWTFGLLFACSLWIPLIITQMSNDVGRHWTFGLLFACSLWIPLLF